MGSALKYQILKNLFEIISDLFYMFMLRVLNILIIFCEVRR